MNLTVKQIEIMKAVAAGQDGAALDIDQLVGRLPYATTKASLQFSLRALEKHGLIDRTTHTEYRRGRIRRLLVASALGMGMVSGTGRPAPGPQSSLASLVEAEETPVPRIPVEAEILPEPEVSVSEMSGSEGLDFLPQSSFSLPELTFSEPLPLIEEELID